MIKMLAYVLPDGVFLLAGASLISGMHSYVVAALFIIGMALSLPAMAYHGELPKSSRLESRVRITVYFSACVLLVINHLELPYYFEIAAYIVLVILVLVLFLVKFSQFRGRAD